ncbi:MAG TPA: glycosyltransferase [Candidatus Omnitrophota bacterium]|nr:glycosyltransferase [Candidatus Omnitrophota bacterium]
MPADPPPLRVMLLLHAPTGGGAQRRVLQLAGALAARGVAVELALAERRGELAEQVPPVRVTMLRGPRWPNRMARMAAVVPDLAMRLRRDRPDVLVGAANHVHLAALTAHALAGRPCPLVLRVSNHLGGRRGRPLVDWVKRRTVALYRRADALVAVSEDIARQLRQLAPGADVRVLPNPVVDGRLVVPLDLGGTVVLGVGRLEKQKDFPTLIRAAARLRVRLVILGEGSQRRELQELARSLGVDLHLPGFVADPLPWMAGASAFALSSAWEGMPGALIEAMACGTPVVSTDCPGGAAEILRHGQLGPLVPVGDDAALAEALRHLLAHPPDREALRRRAADFSVEAGAEAYLSLFTELCGRHPTTG